MQRRLWPPRDELGDIRQQVAQVHEQFRERLREVNGIDDRARVR